MIYAGMESNTIAFWKLYSTMNCANNRLNVGYFKDQTVPGAGGKTPETSGNVSDS